MVIPAKIQSLENFVADQHDQYLKFKRSNPELAWQTVVLKVNMGLHRPFYDGVTVIDDPSQYHTLVNTFHRLDQEYKPSDLETISFKCAKYSYLKLRRDAKHAFEEMCDALIKEGYELYATSGYRSFATQARIYKKREVKRYTARAGHSEHQTGLAVDVIPTREGRFDDVRHSKVYRWYQSNAHRFGFIIRFPYNVEHITGFPGESWHLRFLGVKLATAVYESGLSYDEYYALYLSRSD